MRISLGCDHGGFETKLKVKDYLIKEGYEVIDVGCDSLESCNYAEFGIKAAEQIRDKKADFGIVICTSAEGICMAANKVNGVLCGIGYNDDVAGLLRTHNNANMIAFAAKFMSIDEIITRIKKFLSTDFEGGRHIKRVETMLNYRN